MPRLLVVFASIDAQAERIANRVLTEARAHGFDVVAGDPKRFADAPPVDCAAAVVLATVHEGRHSENIAEFVREHGTWLRARPAAFLSLNPEADADHRGAARMAQESLDAFLRSCDWSPELTLAVAGTLQYPLAREIACFFSDVRGRARAPETTGTPWERLDRKRIAASIALMPVFFGLTIFWPAGTLAWPEAWSMLAVFVPAWAASAVYLWRTNPEMVIARTTRHTNSKSWDVWLLSVLVPLMVSVWVVAGLDERFGGSEMGTVPMLLGYPLFLFGIGVSTWASRVNPFFEPTVRIQSERGHRVIDTGPYAYVRHPGYVGLGAVFTGFALALGSWWALVPAFGVVAGFALRTHWEDETLAAELEGYREYRERVPFKLIPKIW